MKQTLLIALFTLLTLCSVNAQENLVLNAGFENSNESIEGVYRVKAENNPVLLWQSPLRETPSYFKRPQKSVAQANNGSASIGLTLGGSKHEKVKYEYITGNLSQKLVKDQVYCICFYAVLHKSSRWAATDIGILLHSDKHIVYNVEDPTEIVATTYANGGKPITNTKWRKYCTYYRANGTEKYISIGKFGKSEAVSVKDLNMEPYFELNGMQTKAYYQFDDLSVIANNDSIDCGCADNFPVPDTTVKPKLKPYLFTLDASGSMRRSGLFDSLRSNLVRVLRDLPDGTPVTFSKYSSSAKQLFVGTKNEHTISKIDSILDAVRVGGGTNVVKGLDKAYNSWEPEEPDSAKVILISDGEFSVNNKILEMVKDGYERLGRKLTVVQIDARAVGLEILKPYMDAYIRTSPEDLHAAISSLRYTETISTAAVACECGEEYSDIMNYHFVIDYSGSMRNEKSRAIDALKYLYEKAPDSSIITITSFNTSAKLLYSGKKSDMNLSELLTLLHGVQTGGGTDPAPGVAQALGHAKSMAVNRFSHIILITDLKTAQLSSNRNLTTNIHNSMKEFDMAASAITVDGSGIISLQSQFDITTDKFYDVPRQKFETDLFETMMSSCDYSTQAYHYSAAKETIKKETKKLLEDGIKIIIDGVGP
jgi:Mg-chelatase subunit ChlD